MMRVGLLIYGSLETISGGYLYDRQLAAHLREQGDEVEVISLPWRNYASHLLDNFSTRLRRQLCALSLDVLIQDELNHPSLVWMNRRLWGAPGANSSPRPFPLASIIHHLRSSEVHPPVLSSLYRWVERQYLASLDGFIFNSRTTRQEVERLMHGAPLRSPGIVAVPAGDRLGAGLEENDILHRTTHTDELRFVFLGNVIPRKGLHTLLDAMEILLHRQPDCKWRLEVIGETGVDRGYARRIRQRLASSSLRSRVMFSGRLDAEELASHLKANHVLVVPSQYEGFGIAYLEGMGFGLPAIASTGGGATEIITDGVDGFLIPPENPQALADRLQLLACADPGRRRLMAMRLAARQRYLAHPRWSDTMAKIRAFLIELCELFHRQRFHSRA